MNHLPEDFIKDLLLDKISDIVIVTDAKGNALWVNESFTRLTGYTLDEVFGVPPGRILQGPETNPETVKKMRRAIKEGKPFRVNILNYSKNGRKYWLNIDTKPILDPKTHEIKYYIGIERDVTAEKQSEQKVINNYLLQLQEVSEEREKLIRSISMLSHDLKSPINRILGLLPLIDMQKLSDVEQDTLNFIRKECLRLKKLSEKILFAHKGGKELKVELQWMSVNDVICDLIKAYKKEAEEKKLTIQFKTSKMSLKAKLDYILLHQVIENLLSNAIKYSTEDTTIYISTKSVGERIHITIKDEGPGISLWKQKHLFSPFQTLSPDFIGDSSSSGMGLFIVKKYVDLLDGTIKIDSEEGAGTSFLLKFWKDVEKSSEHWRKSA